MRRHWTTRQRWSERQRSRSLHLFGFRRTSLEFLVTPRRQRRRQTHLSLGLRFGGRLGGVRSTPLHSLKVLLRVRSDLDHRSRANHPRNHFPLLAMHIQASQEDLVLFFGPSADLFLAAVAARAALGCNHGQICQRSAGREGDPLFDG